jgi:hypothetical protein
MFITHTINLILHAHKINVMVSFSNVTGTADEGYSPCATRSKCIAAYPLSNSVDTLAVILTLNRSNMEYLSLPIAKF